MKILVTGSEGFIGKNLVPFLEKEEHEVIGWDKKSGKDIGVEELPKDIQFIFHLACIPQMDAACSPWDADETNAYGTRNMAAEAKNLDIPIIYTSSVSVFGQAPAGIIKEDTPFNPMTDYAISKLAGEYYFNAFGPDRREIIRLSNVYGPWQTPDENENCGIVGKFIYQCLHGQPMTLVGDGSQSRDFTYVEDVNWALYDTFLRLTQDTVWRYYPRSPWNFGSGHSISIAGLAHKIGTLISDQYSIKSIPERSIDGIWDRVVDNTATDIPLDSGLRETIEWFRAHYKI